MKPIEKTVIDEYLRATRAIKLKQFFDPGPLVKLLRCRLALSIESLAKRSGVSHATIERIESGRTDTSMKTLKKLFTALGCDSYLLAIPIKDPDQILRERAQRIASKKMNYVRGTMALEKQEPDAKWMNVLYEEEVAKLLKNPSKLWIEDGE